MFLARYDVSPYQSGGDYTFAKKGSMFGFKYGLGVEVALTEKINARLEYYRVNYGSNGKGNLDAASGVYNSEKFNFKNDTVRIGISYNIG